MQSNRGRQFLSVSLDPKAHIRLFCLPHAGGGSALFYSWAGKLPGHIQVCPIHLPGREDRLGETPYRLIDRLVADLAANLNSVWKMPFALLGHSVGAFSCFELARLLHREHGIQPACLFVVACRAPSLPDPSSPIRDLDDDSFVVELQRRYSAIPDVVLRDPQLLRLFLPVLKADMAMMETYAFEPGRMLDCPVFAYGGLEDWAIGPEKLAIWREQTRGGFKLRMFPGNHFFLNGARDLLLPALAEDIDEALRSSMDSSPSMNPSPAAE